MDVEWVLLCDSALPHPDGTVSMLGAGKVKLVVPALPAPVMFSVVTRLKLEPTDLPMDVNQKIEFLGAEGDAGGVIEGTISLPPAPDPAHPVWFNIVQSMGGVVTVVGGQTIVVTINDQPARVCPLHVYLQQ